MSSYSPAFHGDSSRIELARELLMAALWALGFAGVGFTWWLHAS